MPKFTQLNPPLTEEEKEIEHSEQIAMSELGPHATSKALARLMTVVARQQEQILALSECTVIAHKVAEAHEETIQAMDEELCEHLKVALAHNACIQELETRTNDLFSK